MSNGSEIKGTNSEKFSPSPIHFSTIHFNPFSFLLKNFCRTLCNITHFKMWRTLPSLSAHPFPTFHWSLLPLFLLAIASLSVASVSFGNFRYVPKHSFGSLYDGGRPHLPRSASTFFASQTSADHTASSSPLDMPDYLSSTGTASSPDLSGAHQLFESEMASADQMPQIGGTELKSKNAWSSNLFGFYSQKGQFARKNCFFSPLQCSFYYKKRSHHRRNAEIGVILSSGKVIGPELLRSKPL